VRLFGNVMSGVFVIGIVLTLAGLIVPIPLMALDLLTGTVQAYIFAVPATVFIGAAVGENGKASADGRRGDEDGHMRRGEPRGSSRRCGASSRTGRQLRQEEIANEIIALGAQGAGCCQNLRSQVSICSVRLARRIQARRRRRRIAFWSA
jgi:hypothetical protein